MSEVLSQKADRRLSVTVPAALDGERVDRGIALLAGISRAQASRLVAEGRAWLSGSPVTVGSRRLRCGEPLLADLGPPPRAAAPAGTTAMCVVGGPPVGALRASQRGRAAAWVVFADEQLVVVDKPAGVVVHPGAANASGTLVQELTAIFPDIVAAGPDLERPGVVHRLDKGTSGLLVVARTAEAREGLVRQMADRSAERVYISLVHGRLEDDEGVIDAPLGRSPSQRTKMAVVQSGRSARTHYWAHQRCAGPLAATSVTCRLETGRTHQVRAHFAALRHPVVGDEQYAGRQLTALTRKVLPGLGRPFLHAARLGFVHPWTGESMSFSSPLPEELGACLVTLGLSPGALGGP